MKSNFGPQLEKLKRLPVLGPLLKGFVRLWQMFSNNFGLKVLSLLIAILLWNFVISSDSTITRTKTVTGLTGYVTGRSTLTSANGLALLEDPADELTDLSVMIEVSQAEFSSVTKDNVMVTLDLSNARREGIQEVPLKAVTSYGRVVKVMPSKVELSLEALDSRVIPVNVQIIGKPEKDRWYKVNRSNPSSLTIKGPASVVQRIASAYVYIDVTGARSGFTAAEQFVLLDSDGDVIPQDMLERSASSISVSVDVYPTKEIPLDTAVDSVITGQPKEGYEVVGIAMQPAALTVAAEQELLDSIDMLHIDPISVEGLSQSFSARADVATLSSFKSISADEVYVTVTIAEETVGAWVEDVKVSYINKGDGLKFSTEDARVRVYVSGPRSAVEELRQMGFVATLDLAGLGAGEYSMAVVFPEAAYPEVTFAPEVDEVVFALTE